MTTSGVEVNEDGSTTDLGEWTMGTGLYGYSGWAGTFTKENVIWANFDILDYDNSKTVHLAASDPIPVGSAHSKFDLYSWLTGYFLSIYGGFKK